MPKANLGEIEIYYEEKGQGEAVLLVPPSWWPSDTWNVGVVPFLSKRFKTIIFDCRGTGRSDKPTSGYSVSQFAKDCGGSLEAYAYFSLSRGGFRSWRPDRSSTRPRTARSSRDTDDRRRGAGIKKARRGAARSVAGSDAGNS